MDLEILQKLDKMELTEARDAANSLIDVKKTKKVVHNRLIYDLDKARNSREVSRIMWQVYMSGSGYGTIGSTWKKHYNNA